MDQTRQLLRGWDGGGLGTVTHDTQGRAWQAVRRSSVIQWQYREYGRGPVMIPLRWWTLVRRPAQETATIRCDRCGTEQDGLWQNLVAEAYLADDPTTHTGALCPTCATDNDPQHVPGSWLLVWSA